MVFTVHNHLLFVYCITNRTAYQKEKEYPQTLTFDRGIDFIRRNAQYDNWFLQIETFDPHEPFDAPDNFTARWFDPDSDDGIDWPPYGNIREAETDIAAMRRHYYALVQFCDKSLGRVLDAMDQYDMWKDTLLLINTDHGFLLGEHDWWGKNIASDYQEIANIPLSLWDPRRGGEGHSQKRIGADN